MVIEISSGTSPPPMAQEFSGFVCIYAPNAPPLMWGFSGFVCIHIPPLRSEFSGFICMYVPLSFEEYYLGSKYYRIARQSNASRSLSAKRFELKDICQWSWNLDPFKYEELEILTPFVYADLVILNPPHLSVIRHPYVELGIMRTLSYILTQ